MKRLFLAALLLLATSASAERTVLVRLFWLHPPERIRIEPNDATLRSCVTCSTKALDSAITLDAHSAQTSIVAGRARLSGDSFQPFSIKGELTVHPQDGLLLLTLKMPLEDYVAAVLAGESAGFKSDEALKAMAVAARTYAVHFGARHKLEGFDFCDTTHCQDVRLGLESARVRAAVVATEGELLWYEGRAAATYYHRSCGGELEDATALDPQLRVPYLRRHQDQYCSRADEWHSEVTKADLAGALSRFVRGPIATVRVTARTESGRVRTLAVNERPISATDFRFAIGRTLGWDKLRSDLYELQDRGDRVSFRGRGQGHGVGLCQTGADAMGVERHNYREILAYYYPGTALGINAQGMRWQKFSGEQIDIVATQQPDVQAVTPVAERALRFATDKTGWNVTGRPLIKVFPSLDIYRDATGEPGWVAASTRGMTIRLQPVRTLQERGALESTLKHEFLHMVIESRSRPDTPSWLSEGLVIYLSDPERVRREQVDVVALEKRLRSARTEPEMRAAYRDAAAAVAAAVKQHSLSTVLSWATDGVPARPY
ncbi:MAG: SpoIID/LytB domain-containing protein [Terriglobales bacterium]